MPSTSRGPLPLPEAPSPVHTQTQLKTAYFGIQLDGVDATVDDVFPGWHRHDRFGLVIHDALGGVGASHLLQLAISSYYGADDRRRNELTVYPEIYAFHVGGGHGSHADYDFWGPRREVILGDGPDEVIAAINSHGITRIAVPDGVPGAEPPGLEVKEVGAFRDLVASAFAYSPTGRTAGADIELRGLDPRTEQNPTKVLHPQRIAPPVSGSMKARRPMKELDARFNAYQNRRSAELSQEDVDHALGLRERISVDGLACETYRRIGVEDALRRLART